MKKVVQWGIVLAFLATAAWAATEKKTNQSAAPSMDPLVVASDMYKSVFENDRVRVMEVTFQPGQKIAKHSHPDHYVYVLSDGQLTISKPDAQPTVADLKKGQVIWIPAETHWAQNTGKTVIQLLVNELKPTAEAAKKS